MPIIYNIIFIISMAPIRTGDYINYKYSKFIFYFIYFVTFF